MIVAPQPSYIVLAFVLYLWLLLVIPWPSTLRSRELSAAANSHHHHRSLRNPFLLIMKASLLGLAVVSLLVGEGWAQGSDKPLPVVDLGYELYQANSFNVSLHLLYRPFVLTSSRENALSTTSPTSATPPLRSASCASKLLSIPRSTGRLFALAPKARFVRRLCRAGRALRPLGLPTISPRERSPRVFPMSTSAARQTPACWATLARQKTVCSWM